MSVSQQIERFYAASYGPDPFGRLRGRPAGEHDQHVLEMLEVAADDMVTSMLKAVASADIWDIPSTSFAVVATDTMQTDIVADLLAAGGNGDMDQQLARATRMMQLIVGAGHQQAAGDRLAEMLDDDVPDGAQIAGTFAVVPLDPAYGQHPLTTFASHVAPDCVLGLITIDEAWMHDVGDTITFAGETVHRAQLSLDHRGAAELRFACMQLRNGLSVYARMLRGVEGIEVDSSSNGKMFGGRVPDAMRRTLGLEGNEAGFDALRVALTTYLKLLEPHLSDTDELDTTSVSLRPDLLAGAMARFTTAIYDELTQRGFDIDDSSSSSSLAMAAALDSPEYELPSIDDYLGKVPSNGALDPDGLEVINERGWWLCQRYYEMFSLPARARQMVTDPEFPDAGLKLAFDHGVFVGSMADWMGPVFIARIALPDPLDDAELTALTNRAVRAGGRRMLGLRELLHMVVD